MSETLKCISISNQDMRQLFSKILSPENISLVRGDIPETILSHTAAKKISRCFNELEYAAGYVFMEEGDEN